MPVLRLQRPTPEHSSRISCGDVVSARCFATQEGVNGQEPAEEEEGEEDVAWGREKKKGET